MSMRLKGKLVQGELTESGMFSGLDFSKVKIIVVGGRKWDETIKNASRRGSQSDASDTCGWKSVLPQRLERSPSEGSVTSSINRVTSLAQIRLQISRPTHDKQSVGRNHRLSMNDRF
ncbi:hypothetical protein [Phyllobacterium sophorae]|uniref:hypothetical protein n=1 Tax=Phyllobacterium sophorae TaxID=1520277 RepID=UPI0011B22787|nr:hypothetical protein [Phyllobacterium sophorae]